jgi:[ribosomal protein S5]-alanine N-acetyltransferase
MELRGPHLTLRPPARDDAPALLALASDPAVTRWFSWGPYTDLAQPLAWIAEQEDQAASGRQLDFVIHDREHGPIGVTGLGELSRRDRRAMVGTWLGRAHWGTGANAESKALVAHAAFEVCGMERLGAYSNPENVRSARALERVGFTREGTLRGWHRHAGDQLDVHVFGMLRGDWEAGPLREARIAVIGTPPPAWIVSEM